MERLFSQRSWIWMLCALLQACNLSTFQASEDGGSGVQMNGAVAPAVSLKVFIFQGQPKRKWILDANQYAYTSSGSLLYSGTCSRGIASVNVYVANVSSGNVKCGLHGTFSWGSASTLADGTYPVRFTPVAGNGKEYTGADYSHTIVIDTAVPAAPVITSPTGQNILSSTLTILATVASPNTDKIIAADSSGTITYAFPNFSAIYNLNPGQTSTYTFYAQSKSGLTSPGTSIKICYLASANLMAFENVGAAVISPSNDPSGSGRFLSSVTMGPFLSASGKQTQDGHKIRTGIPHYVH